jgi:ribonuclease H / adenosylcobalamin/alpha-ribazole phosphatase
VNNVASPKASSGALGNAPPELREGGESLTEENAGGMRAVLYFDGGGGVVRNGAKTPAAFAAILRVDGEEDEYVIGRRAPSGSSHNVAEYNGLLVGLEHALGIGVADLTVYGDSQLVINQMSGRSKVKAEHLKELHARSQELANQFERIRFEWVPRARNAGADRLVRSVLDGDDQFAVATPRARPPGTASSQSQEARLGAIAAALEELAQQVRELAQESA